MGRAVYVQPDGWLRLGLVPEPQLGMETFKYNQKKSRKTIKKGKNFECATLSSKHKQGRHERSQ